MKKRVVITGMGVVAPNAHGLDNFEQALKEGRSGIHFIPQLEELKFGCQIAGIPEDFETIRKSYFDREKLLSNNDNIGFASVSAVDAWRDAGFIFSDSDDDLVDWDTGVIAGSGTGSGSTNFSLMTVTTRTKGPTPIACPDLISTRPSIRLPSTYVPVRASKSSTQHRLSLMVMIACRPSTSLCARLILQSSSLPTEYMPGSISNMVGSLPGLRISSFMFSATRISHRSRISAFPRSSAGDTYSAAAVLL